MAEIFCTAAAGLALLSQVTTCAVAIRKATKTIKNSRRDVAKLSQETVIFAGLCGDFLNTCDEGYQAKSGASSSISSLNTLIDKTSTRLFEILQKVEALRRNRKHRSSLQETLIAYLEWYFSKSEVKSLRVSLKIARASMSVFSNLICIRKLNQELQMLHNALRNERSQQDVEEKLGMKIERKIRMVEQTIEIKSSVHYTNKRELKTAKKEITLKQPANRTTDQEHAPDDSLDFTKSLEAYAREVLPSVRLSRYQSANHVARSALESSFEVSTPRGWHPKDSYSQASSYKTRRSHNSRTESSRATSSSVSASISSGSSSPHSTTTSTSTSNISSTTAPTVEPKSSESNPHNPRRNTSIIIEHRDMKAREYINDPDGDILSHPKIKPRAGSVPVRKTRQIGPHTIILEPTRFRINKHVLRLESYAIGDAFFHALLHHKDKLDVLVEALAVVDREATTDIIPGWVVHSGEVTMLDTQED